MMAKKNNLNKIFGVFFSVLVFMNALYAQDIHQYWSGLNPNQMSSKVDGDQIKLCTAIKMLILPEAKKIAAYENTTNDMRYMRLNCPSEDFLSYANLLNDLQKDILSTQKILKSHFAKEWNMEGLEKAFINSFTSENSQTLNCYAPGLELNVDQKYMMYLAIMELQNNSYFGVVINDTRQRRAVLRLFERIFRVKSNMNGRYELDPMLSEMILELKEEALQEAKKYQLINPEVFDELSSKILETKN